MEDILFELYVVGLLGLLFWRERRRVESDVRPFGSF